MVSKKKKKYSVGEGAQFMSRRQALNVLQLSLNDFRRLCIIKGIYPREPRNRKRAQKGATGIKTLYHKKDIQFLMHEPIIWKLREYKVFNRKVGRARAVRDFKRMKQYLDNHPTIKLDHIVKERYPTFIDAIQDLDDCLTLCFLFSTFPSLPHIPRDQSLLCRRLAIEFLHYVIEAKALRKVFISIKGYYFQADILGQVVTWIVPHQFSFEPQSKQDVDFKVMSIFVEFYIVMLGFVNFRLFHSLNLYYPPTLPNLSVDSYEATLADETVFVSEKIAALNAPIAKSSNDSTEEDVEVDSFEASGTPEAVEEAKKEATLVKNLKTMFKGLKFFLSREVPREPLVFIIRCFGGEVSWDRSLFVGSTFDENDETITHQIIDRPLVDKQYISRYYIQPQWVFDSVNNRQLLPVNKYFIGELLPPHLSPFVDKERDPRQQYIPPEEAAVDDPSLLQPEPEEDKDSTSEEEEVDQGDKNEDKTEQQDQKLLVKSGELYKEDPNQKRQQEIQEYKLREKMVKNKHRKLYKSMKKGRLERSKEVWLLKKKRRLIDEDKKAVKKEKSK